MRYLSSLSIKEAKLVLEKTKTIICPITSSEPVWDLPIDTLSSITKKIAEKLSLISGIYITTPISSGISTPFKPIGDIGLHKNRFRALVSDSVCSLNEAGVKKIYFVISSDNFISSIKKGINDYRRKLTVDFEYEIISWQSANYAKKIAENHFENLEQYWRNEAAVFLLAQELRGVSIPKETGKLPFSKENFLRWKKCGLDPDKLRKLTPDYRFSSWTNFCLPKFSIYENLCNEIAKKITFHKADKSA